MTFRLCDIQYPQALTVMETLFADKIIEGDLIHLTVADQGEAFALVLIDGLDEPVLIAESKLTRQL